MGHPDEGMIRALLDGEAQDKMEFLGAHLAECPQCAEMAAGQEADLRTLGGALSLLDTEPPFAMARARVLKENKENRRRWIHLRRNLPRAASFAVLLTAGAAAALPGSPVRQWMVSGWEVISGAESPSSIASPAGEEGGPVEGVGGSSELVGATLLAGREGIELHVSEFAPTASLTIVLVEGNRAGIFTEEGTRFRSESGRLEALGPPGDVTVEIPSEARQVLVVVNGNIYLRKTDQGLELLGPVRARTPTEIRFGPSGPSSNGPPSGG